MVGVSPKAGCCTKATNAKLMGDLKIDLEFASKVHFGVRSNTGPVKGDCNILTIGGPIRLMYIIVLTCRSIWVLIWGCIMGLLVGMAF